MTSQTAMSGTHPLPLPLTNLMRGTVLWNTQRTQCAFTLYEITVYVGVPGQHLSVPPMGTVFPLSGPL